MSKTSVREEPTLSVEVIETGPIPTDTMFGKLVRDAYQEVLEMETDAESSSRPSQKTRPKASQPMTRGDVRVIYGKCPQCRGDNVMRLPDGDPLCPNCGWCGPTIPGELVPVEPEGEPMSYETSVTFIEDYKRRSEEHRAKKKNEGTKD